MPPIEKRTEYKKIEEFFIPLEPFLIKLRVVQVGKRKYLFFQLMVGELGEK